MSGLRVQRRLAAILAADVVGYSRLMGEDEAGTLIALRSRRREILSPLLRQFSGRLVKVMGDGVLVEFASAVDAAQCALELQKSFAAANEGHPTEKHIVLRIGINLGDVIVEGDDLYGDGVNIAARLEALADAGGIVVSDAVCQQILGKLDANLEDLGSKPLKNIAHSVQVYRITAIGDSQTSHPYPMTLALPDRPSIAVLPFSNMSGDADQEYFADGMVEELTTALSRMKWLFVIARNSTFVYKGKAIDVKRIGRELGVRYVLEGSVRKAGDRVRITGQLIDASTGTHLWAERFEGSLAEIFDLQDQVTSSVVAAIAPKLELIETERARRKPTESLDAYDYFLRGMAYYNEWKQGANVEARAMFLKAFELDPLFASAIAMAARCHVQHKAGGWPQISLYSIEESVRLARLAAKLGGDDAFALCFAGFTLAWVGREVQEGTSLIEKALELNPNMAWAWIYGGWAKVWQGEPEVAIDRIAKAIRLNPQDPLVISIGAANACAYFFAGRHAEAWNWARKSVEQRPDYGFPLIIAAASAIFDERMDEATRAAALIRKLMPTFRVTNLVDLFPLQRQLDVIKFSDGLRRAGVPE